MMMVLSKASWSLRYSNCLCGFVAGEFVHTTPVWRQDGDTFKDSYGTVLKVESWQPDGYGYSDRKKEK